MDDPPPTRRRVVLRVAGGVVVSTLGVVGAWHSDPPVSWVAFSVLVLGIGLIAGAVEDTPVFRDDGQPTPARQRLQEMWSLAFLAVFFTISSSVIAWAIRSPDGGCVDCDSLGGHVLFWSFLIAGWGMALVCVREYVRRYRHRT